MEKKRLFAAIAVPNEIKTKIEELQKSLKRFARDAKWVKPEGIHLTLKFLGYVDEDKIPSISESLQQATSEFAKFSVEARGCGFFPNQRRPAVFWIAVNSPQIVPFANRIDEAMATLGFEKEKRPFTGHLTICRFREQHGLLPLARESEQYRDTLFGHFHADRIHLYQSILHREGAEYIKLVSFPLKKTTSE